MSARAAAITRRHEFLCWGFLSFAKNAGEEALRRHGMQLLPGDPTDPSPDEQDAGPALPSSGRRDAETQARSNPEDDDVSQLKAQLERLQQQMHTQWRAEAASIRTAVEQLQSRCRELCCACAARAALLFMCIYIERERDR